jgi:NAD-dependent SIR2 family protein deacetylase
MDEVLILTGAGASAEANVPTAFSLTERMDERLRGVPLRVYRYTVGGLMMAKGAEGVSPFAGLNVEEVFSAVELLAERSTLEAAPFISAWHRGVDSLEASDVDRFYRTLTEEIGKSLMGGASHLIAPTRLRKPLAHMLGGGQSVDETSVFKETAIRMVEVLQDCITIESQESVAYLAPLLRLAQQSKATICTLNYDTALEMAAEREGLRWSTGIAEWDQTGRFETSEADIELLKLHGSITWAEAEHAEYEHVHIVETHWSNLPESPKKRYLLFGQREKLRVEGPFLDLLAEFRERLRRARVVVVIGYSFGDAHVNHYLTQWLRQTNRPHLIVIRPGTSEELWKRRAFDLWLEPTDREVVTHIASPTSEGLLTLEEALQTWVARRANEATRVCEHCDKVIAVDREFCLWCHRGPRPKAVE